MQPLLLLDTFSLFYRAFHALPAMNASSGQPTSALYGMSVLLLKLLREERPRGLAFALDAPGPSFRREQYDAYKAGRAKAHPDLSAQRPLLPKLIAALGAPSFEAPGFEADDVLATLAAELSAAGERVVVVSGDRDLLQVVDERVEVLFVGRRGQDHVRYDVAAVEARFGLPPDRLPSYVALVGDPSDNLPKVPGVGAKTASRWIAEHRTVDAVLAADALKPARLLPALHGLAEPVRRNERLATLRRDVPLDGPRHAPFDPPAAERLAALFAELEFKSLQARLAKLPA